MKITRYRRSESDGLDDITALLEGRVFHVAKLTYLDSILRDGEIRTNVDGTLPTSFGYLSNGYFRKRGCVSLFDYRTKPSDEIQGYRNRCSPFIPARLNSEGIAIFVLPSEIHESLVPWSKWKDDNALSDMIVPYVEAGHLGSIPVSMIDEIICLTLEEDQNSFLARLRKARGNAG